MVRTLDIKINAAHPELPLDTLSVFKDAPFSARISNIPKRIGAWSVTEVFISVTMPSNEIVSRPCVNVSGVWVATLPGCDTTGTSENGYEITANGVDEQGTAVTGYCFGRGDFDVMERDGTIFVGGKSYYFHFLDDIPEHPVKGDTCVIDETLKWFNGTDWVQFVGNEDAVTRTSANPVKSSGIWSAIWGTLAALPAGLSSLYDWCVAKLGDKRDETDLSVYDFKFRFDFGDSGIVTCYEPEWNESGYWFASATDGDGKDYGCYAWGEKERDSYSFDVVGVGPSSGKTFTGFRDVKYKTTDTLATTNGVNASITANEKTGTDKQIVRGALLDGGRHWDISVLQADTADFARELASEYWTEPAGVSGRPTTLSGYGITDGATKESFAPEYSATSAYSVGAIVYRDGSIYQCKTAIADGGEAWNAEHWELRKLDDFFTESNSLLTGTIDARLPYPLYAVPSTGLLKDRAINTTSLASVTVPDNFTDLLIRTTVASSLAVTMPEAITKYGDTFPGEAGEYLITITKTGAAEAYVRTIKLEEVANA